MLASTGVLEQQGEEEQRVISQAGEGGLEGGARPREPKQLSDPRPREARAPRPPARDRGARPGGLLPARGVRARGYSARLCAQLSVG